MEWGRLILLTLVILFYCAGLSDDLKLALGALIGSIQTNRYRDERRRG